MSTCSRPQRCRYLRELRATVDHRPLEMAPYKCPQMRGRAFCVLKDLAVYESQERCRAYVAERPVPWRES